MAEKKLVIEKKRFSGETAVVSARLPKSMIHEIDKAADETGYNRNEIITICLSYAIQHLETRKPE